MKRFFVAIGIAAWVTLILGNFTNSTLAAPQTTAGYIVVFKDNVANHDHATDRLEREHGFSSEHRYSAALKGFSAQLNPAQLARIKANPNVAFVSEDRIVEAIGSVPSVNGDLVPTGVRRIDAGTTATVHQASNVNVAVIDTGIYLSHPDLAAVDGKNCVRKNRAANDDNGHGTHVAGTIAAKNNGAGVEGVAPGTKLYAVKVLNSQGSGTWSQVICGIDWVTANASALNIKVANMSLSGGGTNDNNCGNTNGDAMHKAICKSVAAGVTYVVAAGNSATNLDTSVPAAYPEALTVTAMSDSDGLAGGTGGAPACRNGELDDKYASFSNYASPTSTAAQDHTVAGPGVCIYSTWRNGEYYTISGTSMATPHVSGVVALCIGNGGTNGPCYGKSPAQIIQQIRSDAQKHATATNGFIGDPSHVVTGKYFGFLAWAGGY